MKPTPARSPVSHYKLWFSLILGVPIAALIAFSSVLVSEKWDVLLEMDELDNASHLINRSSDLVHEIQKERGYTSGFIASQGKAFKAELLKQRIATDKQYSGFIGSFSSIRRNAMWAAIVANPDLAIMEMGKLREIREKVDSLQIGYFEALEYYSKTNSLLLDTISFVPPLIADKEISSLYLAYFHLEQIKEKAGQQRANLIYAFQTGKFLPGQYERFLAIVSDESYSNKRFLSLAPLEIQHSYLNISTLYEVKQADWMRKAAIAKGMEGNFKIDAADWNAMQTVKIDRIDDVCSLLEVQTEKMVDDRHTEAKTSLMIYLFVNIAVVAFALSMAVLLFQNIAKRREAEEKLSLHAKRMENALFRAKDVLNFIATSPDIVPFFTISPVYRSVRSIGGGDIVKWARFRSQYAGLYLHDVAGHDIEEILLNILAASLVDVCKTNPEKKSASAPPVFLNCLNDHLIKYCEGRPDYLTAIYMLMDFEERKIRLAVAGHPRPWLINPDGTILPVDVPPGFILGQFAIDPITNDRYQDIAFRPERGQLLLVYSDGLMEQKDAGGKTFEAKFLKEIGPKAAGLEPRAAYEVIQRGFEAHLNGRTPEDDVSFVLIGTRPADKYETVRFVPGQELLSLISTHKNIRDNNTDFPLKEFAAKNPQQSPWKPGQTVIHKLSDSYEPIIEMLKRARWADKRINQVELAVSEMVINAIMHGNILCDKCTVELSYVLHGDELEICVADEGSGFDSNTLPQSIEDNLLMEGGRGHHMISAMADGLYFNDTGNRCWALFERESSLP